MHTTRHEGNQTKPIQGTIRTEQFANSLTFSLAHELMKTIQPQTKELQYRVSSLLINMRNEGAFHEDIISKIGKLQEAILVMRIEGRLYLS